MFINKYHVCMPVCSGSFYSTWDRGTSRIIMLVYNGFSFVRIVVELLVYSFVNITLYSGYGERGIQQEDDGVTQH